MFTDHSEIKLEINNNKKKTNRKSPKVLKLSSILLHNPYINKINQMEMKNIWKLMIVKYHISKLAV